MLQFAFLGDKIVGFIVSCVYYIEGSTISEKFNSYKITILYELCIHKPIMLTQNLLNFYNRVLLRDEARSF